jgi:hypothetical protein
MEDDEDNKNNNKTISLKSFQLTTVQDRSTLSRTRATKAKLEKG